MKRRRLVSAAAAGDLRAGSRAGAERRRFGPDGSRPEVLRSAPWCSTARVMLRSGRAAYTLACADFNDYLTGLAWKSWGPRLASATGTEHVNDCVPYCAAGHFHSYPVNVVLWGSGGRAGEPALHHDH